MIDPKPAPGTEEYRELARLAFAERNAVLAAEAARGEPDNLALPYEQSENP